MSFSFTEGPIHKQQIPTLDFLPPPDVDGSNPGVVEANQMIHTALVVAAELAKVCGRPDDLVNVAIIGHANLAHAPAEGWGDESVMVSVMVADTSRGHLEASFGDVNPEADLDTSAVPSEPDPVAAADQAALDAANAQPEGESPQDDAVLGSDGEPKAHEGRVTVADPTVAHDPIADSEPVAEAPGELPEADPTSPADVPPGEAANMLAEPPPIVMPDEADTSIEVDEAEVLDAEDDVDAEDAEDDTPLGETLA